MVENADVSSLTGALATVDLRAAEARVVDRADRVISRRVWLDTDDAAAPLRAGRVASAAASPTRQPQSLREVAQLGGCGNVTRVKAELAPFSRPLLGTARRPAGHISCGCCCDPSVERCYERSDRMVGRDRQRCRRHSGRGSGVRARTARRDGAATSDHLHAGGVDCGRRARSCRSATRDLRR